MKTRWLIVALLISLGLGAGPGTRGASEPTESERISKLISQLASDKFSERRKASRELDALGKPALEALRKATNSPDAETSHQAKELVSKIEKRLGIAPVLSPDRARLAGMGLPFPVMPNGMIPPNMQNMPKMPVMPRFVGMAGMGPMGLPKALPMRALQARADLPKDLVPTLIESLKDKDSDVRKYVASALARVGAEAVEPLIEVLKGKDSAQRANAAYILGQIGADAHDAMPLLIKALKAENKEVRLRSAFAIERILAVPRNPMAAGMGGMMMPFNTMPSMMGNPVRQSTVKLPADPGPVGPSNGNVKPVN